MAKKILITGGAGYIGSHTALELLNEGYEVVVYDNLCNSSKESLKRVEELTGKHITFYEGDVMDEAALKEMFEKENVDAVIHCAALKAVGESVQKPLEYYRNNITGTLTLMDVIIQTWTLFSDIPRQCPVTGTDLKKLLHQFNGIFHSSGTGIGTIIF